MADRSLLLNPLSGSNAAYLETLYEAYLEDPQQVDEHWRQYFSTLPAIADNKTAADVSHQQIKDYFANLVRQPRRAGGANEADLKQCRKQTQVAQLINAFRSRGHHQANLDPLHLVERTVIADLTLDFHGLAQSDLHTNYNTSFFANLNNASLEKIYNRLQEVYCATVGAEFMHISSPEETQWIQNYLENESRDSTTTEKRNTLELLTAAEGLEQYLGKRYVGQKRFSLEGAESVIPALDLIIQRAGSVQVKELVLGMAHRGRLNVLINTLGKSPADLFKEFEGKKQLDPLSSGDVKYHMGFSSDVETPGGELHLTLAFNPSHLEIISPVVEGSVRARQARLKDAAFDQVVPVILHGDAAFAGQGVVMETFNMSQARGFATGGTVHIIINNQVGFTTSNPLDARSTLYCTDIAKMVQAPIFHVNGDDPDAVIFVSKMAFDYRMKFKKDVVIDLVCYRRHGHNEADEPMMTQPLMYQVIKNLPTTRKLYADQLIEAKVVAAEDADAAIEKYRQALDAGSPVAKTKIGGATEKSAVNWKRFIGKTWQEAADTRLTKKTLDHLVERLNAVPEGFNLHSRVAKVMADRKSMGQGELDIDWGYGETLAYASLLNENYAVRLCGQDSGRGTFSHRHAVLHDVKTGQDYLPLQHLSEKQAQFTVIDSVLSEAAVLAFEYGYATTEPDTLVLWEAQFGDFANGAQVVIDQFISSGQQKWGRLSGLVMLLPHGYEGAGPEHSSARLERFLQLCAEKNMQVCVPTTPAQAFHMLRRQMVHTCRMPLVVMTPKSLLRHKLAVSKLKDFTEGHFHNVIAEIDAIDAKKVRKVVLCSGKVYYELLQERRKKEQSDIAIIRIEQLYPFPHDDLTAALKPYTAAKEIIWCQEEPRNQGAWYATRHHLEEHIQKGQSLAYAGRPHSASPAAGSAGLHEKQQLALIEQALT